MNSIVVYSSKTGFVERYAKWIAEDLSANLAQADEVGIEDLMRYDTIIYGGGLYAVGINGIKLIKNNLERLKEKNLIVFATGASPPRERIIEEVKEKNFTPDEQRYLEFFYLRGGFDYEKLGLKDRMLMKMLKKKLKMKKELTPDEKGMLEAYEDPVDFTKKENIGDLLDYARGKSE